MQFKIPEQIFVTDVIPKTATGKVGPSLTRSARSRLTLGARQIQRRKVAEVFLEKARAEKPKL